MPALMPTTMRPTTREPRSLFAAPDAALLVRPSGVAAVEPGVVLTRDESEALAKRVLSFATGPATVVYVESEVEGNTRFAHNTISAGRDALEFEIHVRSTIDGKSAEAWTSQVDDDGLRETVALAEQMAKQGPKRIAPRLAPAGGSYSEPKMWHDATNVVALDARGEAARIAASAAQKAGLVGAGAVNVVSASHAVANSSGLFVYSRQTNARLTVSARMTDDTGSGWACAEAYDWGGLRVDETAARAVDKCRRSAKPVAVEPGRYTAILEPAAYGLMVRRMMKHHMYLEGAEAGWNAFAKKGGGTKIGLRVLDPRLSVVSDPNDAVGPFFAFNDDGLTRTRTAWIDHGVLKTLGVDDEYAQEKNKPEVVDNPVSCRLALDGTPTSVDEMIATTTRGVYVTRVGGLIYSHFRTLLFTGVTRDGLWLIENGKITRPIKNFRFLESPLFFLNNVEQVGTPQLVPVVNGEEFVLPPIKVRDFNFTSLADAI